jgi:hypothetical protein
LTAIISLIIRAPPQNCDRHQLLSLLKTPLAFGTPAEKDWKSPSAEISGQCNNDVARQIQPCIRLEFAIDSRRSPEHVTSTHGSDQFACFLRNAGPSGFSMPNLPGPIPTKTPGRSQSMTVSGLTIMSADRQRDQNRDSQTHKRRSGDFSLGFRVFHCRTVI